MDALTTRPPIERLEVDPNTRPDDLLPARVAARTTAAPGDVAVVDTADPAAGSTYAELEQRVQAVAGLLHARGVGRGALVAVCLHRGVDLVAALLAVWRVGAAYVPLDPAHPDERLAWMLTDTEAAVVLTQTALVDRIRRIGGRAVNLDDPTLTAAPVPGAVDLSADDAAYVIYTSGSTGRPKGVVIGHGGIANRVLWTVRQHDLGPGDRVLQKTSIGFDAAGWEFFAPLVSGGTVVLAPAGAERDPAALVAAIVEHEITVLQGVPSVLRLLVAEPTWLDCTSLRLIFSAGEPLHSDLCRSLSAAGKAEIWNTYGPTECSIDVTAHRYDPAQMEGPVPIGRPIDGVQIRVLEPGGDPVPVGVPGELFVAGAGLGRGYLNQPGLTSERFVPDPYGRPGSRLYRTGDLARWRTGGHLEFLGRLDDQVKINGVRIEPGEVEAALIRHPEVRAAVVLPELDDTASKRLVAYLLSPAGLPADAIRTWLRDRVPDALIPSNFVVLKEFPLTTSGKVDRAGLPAAGLAAAETAGERTVIAPRTPAEQLVASVWQDLLGVDEISVDDDFFSLGGSSLVLARLATRLRARSGGDIDLPGLFGASTVAAQAALLTPADPAAAKGPRAEADVVPVPGGVRPVPRTGLLPLSSGQHRLWFLDQMHPGSPEWVAPLFLRLPAGTGTAVVQQALDRLEQRHEALRTRYRVEAGEPGQVVVPAVPVELRVVEGSVERLPDLFAEQFARGFDLVDGPLWRALLVHLPGEEPLLLATIHHIASDGWSTVILERDLRELVAALTAGREPRLADLPVQYADYARWQQERLTDAALEPDLEFWRKQLAGATPTEPVTDRPRPARRDGRGAGVELDLPQSLADAVTGFSRRHGVTPFMTLLTTFATLMARYTGGSDVVIGTPVAGRPREEVGDVVGFFLNSLVLRCDLTGDPTFGTALERVRGTCTDAYAHQEVPFERLVTELQPERDLSRTPLYQVAFDLQEEGETTAAADPTAMRAFQQAWSVAKTDLTLFVWRRADGSLSAAFEYAVSILDADTVQRLAAQYVRLLTQVVADPDVPVSELDLISAPEQALLTGWSANPGLPVGRGLIEDIRRSAAAHPTAVAVQTGEIRCTYAELEARSNQLAHHLRSRGVRAESPVGVLLDRGADLLIAMLGVWKAGGAYVPLDPSFPAERIADMLTTADATVAVSAARYADRFYPSGVQVVAVDVERAKIERNPDQALGIDVDLDQLAYVIFTSGSTGRPKGVAVTHRGLANHVHWAAAQLAGRGTGGAPVFSSVAFDLVVPNLWAPLVVGQRVWMYPESAGLEGLGRALVEAAPFSFVKLTPGHLELLEHQLEPAERERLAQVIVVAGEALPAPPAQRWRDVLGDGRLINEYGPTEASVGTCVHPVVGEQQHEVVPIGRPLPNLTMHVLDPKGRRVPIGVSGELWVGGTGVARGYIGRPELTAERFAPDPFGSPGSRMYRSGDLARVLADGTVAFLGRIDDQVKIRGYRVEPGEIRAWLLEHPGVRDAVVVADGPVGDRRLVAYCVPTGAALPDLVAHCAEQLPGYLVPAVFVALPALPLNANGKVDRAALPVPGDLVPAGSRVAPRTVVEERVGQIWAEVLGLDVDQLDIHTGFFTVGGHSIRAVQLISMLQAAFGVPLSIRVVFERPTVAELADEIETLIRQEIDALSDADLLAQAAAEEGKS